MQVDMDGKLIETIQGLGEKYDVTKIVLFGSRARGDNRSSSDIDLAVYASKTFRNEGKLASDIDDLDTLLKIDVVYINEDSTDVQLIDKINKEGVILYERLSQKVTKF